MEKQLQQGIVENLYHRLGKIFNLYNLPIKTDNPECFVNENTSHVGRDKYAMDFIVPVGTPVYAPARGKIILIQQFYNQASHNPLDGNKVNQIIIRTSMFEECEIKHIEANSCKYKIGDWVEEEEELAKVGLNGFYLEDNGIEFPSHLHFAVHGNISFKRRIHEVPLKVRFGQYNINYGNNGSVVFSNK